MTLPVERIDDYRWQIPAGSKPGMKVPAIIFADEKLMEQVKGDLSLEQAANGATLPGVVRAAYTMPDIHQGYGLPIGAVVAMRTDGGVVTPGGVGYDINCGVRLLRTDLTKTEVVPRIKELVNTLFAEIPSGVGSHGKVRLTKENQMRPLVEGARWAVQEGMGEPEDLVFTEAGGCIPGANPDAVSHKAYERGRDQEGTLGSGNHFAEVQFVDRIYDEDAAQASGPLPRSGHGAHPHRLQGVRPSGVHGLSGRHGAGRQEIRNPAAGQAARMRSVRFRGGSGLSRGHARGGELRLGQPAMPDALDAPGLSSGSSGSPRGISACRVVYDVAHNIAKVEEHQVGGRSMRLVVHRKGATRAFPPGHPELPERYRADRAARPGSRGHGASLVRPGGHARAPWTRRSAARAMGPVAS